MTLLASSLVGISIASLAHVIATYVSQMDFKEGRKDKVPTPLMFKLCLPIARRISHKVPKGFEKKLDDIQDKLIMAGIEQYYSKEEFFMLKFVYCILMCFMAIVFFAIGIPFLGVFLIIVGAFYPTFWLRSTIRTRHRLIQRALPNVLDLLTLSVEAGRDFLTGLREILQNREMDPLGEELERVFREVQLGKQRREALRAMGNRCKQEDLQTVVDTLGQADELGVSIGHILRILGDQMRAKRFSRAEKLANESPVKLLFPLFIFIFPAVIIVMLGPILLRAMQTL